MTWHKGTSGNPSGRPKGSRTKVTVRTREQLEAYLASQQVDPFATLVDLMVRTTDEKVKLQCATVLADRLMPRLKAVEVSGDPERPLHLQMTPEQRQARIAGLLAKRNGQAEE